MIIQLKTILCAIDFSRYTNQMLHYGVGFANRVGARLLVFHSVHYPQDELYAAPGSEHDMVVRKMVARAAQRIEDIMKPYSVNWVPVITKGDPAVMVTRVAEQENADLVMAVSHGISALKRLLVGTVVERMARGLGCPFLVIPPKKSSRVFGPKMAFSLKKMVVGCDLSSATSPALEYGRYFAKFFNAEIHLLHTLESPVNEDIVDKTEGSYSEVQQTLQQRIYGQLLDLYKNEKNENFKFKVALRTGMPGETLIKYVKQEAADLMIVGIKRHGAIEKFLVGSTTEAVIRHSSCPVLVVPPGMVFPKAQGVE